MRLEYDADSDAAYLSLQDGPRDTRDFGFTYTCDPNRVKGQIHLDFDKEDRLIGIEVLDASRMLPQGMLA